MVEAGQDGVAAAVVAVLEHPLDLADPYRDPRQLGGVGVDLEAQHVVGAGLDGELAVQAEGFGVEVGAVFEVFEGAQAEVQEVAGAAGGVEHAEVLEPFEVAQKDALGVLHGLLRTLAAGLVFVDQRGEAGLGGVPLALQGLDEHRADELHDGLGVGVVGAQRGAHLGVEATLEEGAEDGGLDGGPIHLAGLEQRVDLGGDHLDHVDVLEQPAVEVGDVFEQKVAARTHGAKQLGHRAGELAGVALALVDDALEELSGEQADVFGKHAEQALDEEVGDLLGVVAARGHRPGDVGEAAGGVGGDVEHRAAGAKLFGVGEQPAQLLLVFRRADVLEADGVRLARGAGEVGVDLGERAVAHHQQRRVVEGQGVGHELAQRAGQVTAGALVLPAEVPAHPHVRPAMPGPCARGATLEAVVVGVGGGGHAEHGAQIEKERLRTGTLGEGVVLPLGDELGGGHGGGRRGRLNEAGIVAEFAGGAGGGEIVPAALAPSP